jgi:hypothetical protein
MRKIFHLFDSGTTFRVRCDPTKQESVGTCLLVQSGHLGDYDEISQESTLYEALIQELNARRVDVLRVDLQRRDDLTLPAGATHLNSRTTRLLQLIHDSQLVKYLENYVLCGMSLGAQSILQLMTDASARVEPRGVLLLSCVVEEPKVVFSSVPFINLVYGSEDYIAYLDYDAKEINPISPAEYGPESMTMLQTRPWQQCQIRIFDGLNHFLLRDEQTADQKTIAWLTGKVLEMLTSKVSRNSAQLSRSHAAG